MAVILEVIEVAPETKAQLQEAAAQRGISLSQIIGEILDRQVQGQEDVEEAPGPANASAEA